MIPTLMAAAALAAAQSPAADREVQIGSGPSALHGAILHPPGRIAPAAVLFVNGSGPSDRNGDDSKDGERAQPMHLLAEALAARGIASLRYDKRGFAASEGAGEAATVEEAVDEAAGWAAVLAKEPGVRCVIVVGHSEGAEIGALLAAKTHLCGLVSVAGPSQDLGAQIEQQAVLLKRPPEVIQKVHVAIEAMKAGRPVEDVPPGYDSLFGPKAEAYTRSKIQLDPVAKLAAVKTRVMVLQGDNDLQASVQDAQRLASAAHVDPVIIPGATHMLKAAAKDVQANIRTYADPDLPLAPGIAEAIAGFVLAKQ